MIPAEPPEAEAETFIVAVSDVCPYCQVDTEMVTVMGLLSIRCEMETVEEVGKDVYRFSRLIHLCRNDGARRECLKEIASKVPR